MSEQLAARWMRRYKFFFLLGFFILGVQVFLAYKSLGIADISADTGANSVNGDLQAAHKTLHQHGQPLAGSLNSNQNSVSDDEDAVLQQKRAVPTTPGRGAAEERLTLEQLGFQPECDIHAKEAISALQRAKTKDCRKHIAHIACAIQAGQFYARHLVSYCPASNYTANAPLGCYRDEKEFRLLSGYFINFKTTNSPLRCAQLCLQSGYPYAGVQYGTECFCGIDAPPTAAKLADSSCNMKCSGDPREICGGFFSMNVYETGIAKFTARIAETSVKPETARVKIAFLLTLNGRALRQVHRLIRALYSPNHVFYIHVDARQDYLYRKLLELEKSFPNIRLARRRFSTIWGGASLLTMLLKSMEDLLSSHFQWDFVINLSESDFPVKTLDSLVEFLSANKGRNFVKSHGRETQRFIQKQGLDKTFVECDTHMWRIGDRQLPTGIQVDGGSDWVALSRSFVKYVTLHAQEDPLLQGLLTIFRHTLLPAESFFHTVLRNSYYCDTYVDNNLHVTNWKRKLGCKCQYKHVVDWCGCSPNDFKPEDWSRLQGTEHKMLFFARKFEAIINQAILLQLEEWLFGAYAANYTNLHGYWQSLYHVDDRPGSEDDLMHTLGASLMRINARQLQLQGGELIELTSYLWQDQYKGFLLRYRCNATLEIETRIRPVQFSKYAKNSKLAKRLMYFEVSTDFDPKEQVSRNFAKIMGPYSEPVLSFTFLGRATTTHNDASHSYNLTLLWIDPAGQLQDYTRIHIEDTQGDMVHFFKSLLKQPLMPGIWEVKLIGRSVIYAQAKFLIIPLTIEQRAPIRHDRSMVVNGGQSGESLPADFVLPADWQQYLKPEQWEVLQLLAEANKQRTGDDLLSWVDGLIMQFFHMRQSCVSAAEILPESLPATVAKLEHCRLTNWSSLAPDPKSDVYDLLKKTS